MTVDQNKAKVVEKLPLNSCTVKKATSLGQEHQGQAHPNEKSCLHIILGKSYYMTPSFCTPTLACHISSHYLTRNEDIVLGLSDESVYLIRIIVEIFSREPNNVS